MASVKQIAIPLEILGTLALAHGEIRAELGALEMSLKAGDLTRASHHMREIMIQAKWVGELTIAYEQDRPRSFVSRRAFVRDRIHADERLKSNLEERRATVAALKDYVAEDA